VVPDSTCYLCLSICILAIRVLVYVSKPYDSDDDLTFDILSQGHTLTKLHHDLLTFYPALGLSQGRGEALWSYQGTRTQNGRGTMTGCVHQALVWILPRQREQETTEGLNANQ
jgi:hypothetical protein